MKLLRKCTVVSFMWALFSALPLFAQDMVSINYDGVAELKTLPGIGPKKARKIIDYRKQHGRFVRKQDIMKVHGIGPKTYEAIRKCITLRKVKRRAGARRYAGKRPVGQININKASVSELTALPGIGPARAERIVDYRTANGPFKCKSELMDVPGIGKGIFASVEPFIKVRELKKPTRENVKEASVGVRPVRGKAGKARSRARPEPVQENVIVIE